jgi:hypothetical protein
MRINFWAKAFHKFLITVARGIPLAKAAIMLVAAAIYIINWSSRPAASRSTPSIIWKNANRKQTLVSMFQNLHLLEFITILI